MASLPEVSVLEHLGAEGDGTSLADIEVAEVMQQMAGPARGGSGLEALGSADGRLTRAARQDLTRFLETVLTPVLLGEAWLGEDVNLDASQEGRSWALLAIAVRDVAMSPAAATVVVTAHPTKYSWTRSRPWS